jgi:hypothetical protein
MGQPTTQQEDMKKYIDTWNRQHRDLLPEMAFGGYVHQDITET